MAILWEQCIGLSYSQTSGQQTKNQEWLRSCLVLHIILDGIWDEVLVLEENLQHKSALQIIFSQQNISQKIMNTQEDARTTQTATSSGRKPAAQKRLANCISQHIISQNSMNTQEDARTIRTSTVSVNIKRCLLVAI